MPAVEPRPLEPRPIGGAADVDSLVALGVEAPPPTPSPPGPSPTPPPPPTPEPAPDPTDEAVLTAALADAGVTVGSEDTAAVKALARLDSATVAAVAKWVKAKKGGQPGNPAK